MQLRDTRRDHRAGQPSGFGQRPRALLLTDLDNTLFNWVDFFAPCYRAMVHALARAAKVPEEQLHDEFQVVFSRYGSLEYAFAIQELACFKDLPTEARDHLVRTGRGAFMRARKARLTTYEGVPETLSWLQDQGVVVVGVTNSAAYQAQLRLWHLGLDALLYGLVAWEGSVNDSRSPSQYFPNISPVRKKTRLQKVWPVAEDETKPSAAGYEVVMRHFDLSPERVWVIGDSLTKDLLPAVAVNARTIWARYGQNFIKENFETLVRVTFWTPERIQTTYDQTKVRPDHEIDDFRQIVRIIPARQVSLFDH